MLSTLPGWPPVNAAKVPASFLRRLGGRQLSRPPGCPPVFCAARLPACFLRRQGGPLRCEVGLYRTASFFRRQGVVCLTVARYLSASFQRPQFTPYRQLSTPPGRWQPITTLAFINSFLHGLDGFLRNA